MTANLRKRLAHELPFSSFLTDSFGRQHTYLRISLTEKCNLRCVYCMPESGVPLQPSSKMLSTKEVITLSRLFVSEGVKKIRYTGGEPTVRKDLLHIVRATGDMGVPEICITSNGLILHRSLEELQKAGLTGVNLSLDTLEPQMFELITRRKGLSAVMKSLETSLALGIKTKLNVVVLPQNLAEVYHFVELTKDKNLEVRFIEYMPFDGNRWSREKLITYQQIKSHIQEKFNLIPLPHSDTAKLFHVPGHQGTVGFVTSMTHNFCAGCNRVRITADGNLKVCLFDNAEVSLRDLMRTGAADAELLAVIQAALGKKKKEHGDMEDIKREGGRPMILIGGGLEFIQARLYSTKGSEFTHLSDEGEARMVSITDKPVTARTATARGTIVFSKSDIANLISSMAMKKGDVLAVARVASIQAVKATSQLIPLAHPISITSVKCHLSIAEGRVDAEVCVESTGRTGVEMEALSGVTGSLLSVYDMCKVMDRNMTIGDIRVVRKTGGQSGNWNFEESS